jgi:hypothetical protein
MNMRVYNHFTKFPSAGIIPPLSGLTGGGGLNMHPKATKLISQEVLDDSPLILGYRAGTPVTVQAKPGDAGIVSQAPAAGVHGWDKLAGFQRWHILIDIVKKLLTGAHLH